MRTTLPRIYDTENSYVCINRKSIIFLLLPLGYVGPLLEQTIAIVFL